MSITIEIVAMLSATLTIAFAAFWRIWSLIKGVRDEAGANAEKLKSDVAMAKADLSEHRIHVAQTYATKKNMESQTDRIMSAISDIAHDVKETNKSVVDLGRELWGKKEK